MFSKLRNKEQGYLLILIGSDSDELCLWENICPEGAVRKLHYIVGSHNVKSGLVLVHGIQNCLENPQQYSQKLMLLES